MWNPIRKYRAELAALRDVAHKFADSLPGKRLEAIERDLVDLRDLHDELHRSHVRLRSRQGMRELREKDKANGGVEVTLHELERKHGLRG